MKKVFGNSFLTIFFNDILHGRQHAEIGNIIFISAILHRLINTVNTTESQFAITGVAPVDNREDFFINLNLDSKHYRVIIEKIKIRYIKSYHQLLQWKMILITFYIFIQKISRLTTYKKKN